MQDAAPHERIRCKFQALATVMDDGMRRHWAATEAMELGWSGVTCVARATGLSRTTIAAGIRELQGEQGKPSADQSSPASAGRRTSASGGYGLGTVDRSG